MTELIVVITAVALAGLLVVFLMTYVWESDDRARFDLEDAHDEFGVTSMADVRYEETDAEKRVRLGAPRKEDVPANW